jgi:hypothetical protein
VAKEWGAFVASALLSACATGPAPKPLERPSPVATVAPRPEPKPSVQPEPPFRVVARARIAAVGDILMHGAVKESAAASNELKDGRSVNFGGFGALIQGLTPDLGDSEITFANLETPVSPKPENAPKPFIFNAPTEILEAIKAAGVKIVSFANNHVYDQGRPGLTATLEQIEKVGLKSVGSGKTRADAEKPVILEANGIRIAFLGYSQFFNNPQNIPDKPEEAWANPIDPDKMVEAVKAARAQADFVIVSCHWGVEYTTAPRQSEIDIAHRLFEAGADAILGHHPHVLQPIEVYEASDGRACLVIYSLGNFISNQSRQYVHGVSAEKIADTRDGALLKFVAEKRDYGQGVIRTDLADVRYLPLWTDNDTMEKHGKGPPRIRILEIDKALDETRRSIDALVAAKPAAGFPKEQATEYIRLKVRLDLLLRRKAEIAKRLGEDFLSDP